MSKPLEFTCPKCGEHCIEEVQVDITVASDIHLSQNDTGFDGYDYGEQTNDGGHVDRYQCKSCGWTIIDDKGEYEKHTQDGLDVDSLIARIQEMNKGESEKPEVSHEELVQRFADALMKSDGKYLETLWNNECSAQVVYVPNCQTGNGVFRWKK